METGTAEVLLFFAFPMSVVAAFVFAFVWLLVEMPVC